MFEQDKREERRKARYRGDPNKARYRPENKKVFEITIRKDLQEKRNSSVTSSFADDDDDSNGSEKGFAKQQEADNTHKSTPNLLEDLDTLNNDDDTTLQDIGNPEFAKRDVQDKIEDAIEESSAGHLDAEPPDEMAAPVPEPAIDEPKGKKNTKRNTTDKQPKKQPSKKGTKNQSKTKATSKTKTSKNSNNNNVNNTSDSPMRFKRVTRSMTRSAGISTAIKRKYGGGISEEVIIPVSPILRRNNRNRA